MYYLYHNKEVQIFPQFVPWKYLKQLLHCWLQTADISIIFHRYFLALLSFLQSAFAVSIFFQFSFFLQRETTSSIRPFHTSVIFLRICSACSTLCMPSATTTHCILRIKRYDGFGFWNVCFKVLWKLYKVVQSKTLLLLSWILQFLSWNDLWLLFPYLAKSAKYRPASCASSSSKTYEMSPFENKSS